MANKEKNFVSAVVYVHNAEDNIEDFLEMLIRIMQSSFEHSEILCVNDHSFDDSVKKIKQIATIANSTTLSILNMSYFHGLESAMNAGLDLAIGDFVFEFDKTFFDFTEKDIMAVYRKSLEGFDIVSAVPDKKMPITSKFFYKLFNKFCTSQYNLTTESFRILSRRVINRIKSMNKTVYFRKAVYANCGLKMTHITYPVNKNATPVRKWSFDDSKYRLGVAIDSFIVFTRAGFILSISMAFLMIILLLCMIAYSLFLKFTASPVPGWASTVIFLSVAFIGLFGILSVIIKYLQLLVDLVAKRKYYSFESIEKLTK